MLYSGRRPWIKDGIGFQKGDNVKISAPLKRLSNFVKGKDHMPQDNEGYILYPVGYPEDKIRKIHSMIKSYFFQIFGKDTLFSRKIVVFLP